MISAELTIFRRILLISKDIWWKCLCKLDKFINMAFFKKILDMLYSSKFNAKEDMVTCHNNLNLRIGNFASLVRLV